MVDHFEEGGYPAGPGGVSEGTHLSVAAQKEEILRFPEKAGLQVVGWHVGKCCGIDIRPALKELLIPAGSPERSFDTVVVWTWSRLSRSIQEAHAIMSELRELAVSVAWVTESSPAERRGIEAARCQGS